MKRFVPWVLLGLGLAACSGPGTGATSTLPTTASSSTTSPTAATAPPGSADSTLPPTTGSHDPDDLPEVAATTSTVTTAADTAATVVEVTVEDGVVTTASPRVVVDLGSTVRLVVTADVSDEIHVHGYDRSAAVTPGSPGVVEFTATIPGIFEVELEEAGLPLVELEVR